MPRGKKTEGHKGKKPLIDEDTDDEKLEESKKKKPLKTKPRKPKNIEEDDENEDELSELQLDDDNHSSEGDNDEVVTNRRPQNARPLVNPKTPIGELNTNDILSHLIKVGEESLNPQLKYGALDLLFQLTGKKRRNHNHNNNNHNNNYNQRRFYGPRNGNGNPNGNGNGGSNYGFEPKVPMDRGYGQTFQRNHQGNQPRQHNPPPTHDSLYDDNE